MRGRADAATGARFRDLGAAISGALAVGMALVVAAGGSTEAAATEAEPRSAVADTDAEGDAPAVPCKPRPNQTVAAAPSATSNDQSGQRGQGFCVA